MKPSMNSAIWLRVAGPMIVLSLLLLTLGILAAYKVHQQQQESSQLIAREVNGMFAVEGVFIVMREIRHEMNLFLRTHDPTHLKNVSDHLQEADVSMEDALRAARTPKEAELIEKVDIGFHTFERRFEELVAEDTSAAIDPRVADLCDNYLTPNILIPIRECIGYNREVVIRTAANADSVSKILGVGFLLLGISGSIAGLLFGLGIARALSRYIVQLDVSVRGVAGKLHEAGRPVHISRLGDLKDLEFSFRRLEVDIGEIVQTLQTREVELLRNEQLAIVGQLAAGVAHEIRNPLMPIKVLVQAALEKGPDAGIKGQDLIIVNEEIERLERTIQSFLDFARPPALETAYVPIQSILRRSVDLVNAQAAQQQVRIDLRSPERDVSSAVDVGQIHQVILNLLLNAIDALTAGGTIELELLPETQDSRSPPAEAESEMTEHDAIRLLHTPTPQKWFAIRVADNGAGMPTEVIARIFDPFFTTKETGTGLGLPICKRIVTAHGGSIELSNRPSGGAEFMIHLPYRGADDNAGGTTAC